MLPEGGYPLQAARRPSGVSGGCVAIPPAVWIGIVGIVAGTARPAILDEYQRLLIVMNIADRVQNAAQCVAILRNLSLIHI